MNSCGSRQAAKDRSTAREEEGRSRRRTQFFFCWRRRHDDRANERGERGRRRRSAPPLNGYVLSVSPFPALGLGSWGFLKGLFGLVICWITNPGSLRFNGLIRKRLSRAFGRPFLIDEALHRCWPKVGGPCRYVHAHTVWGTHKLNTVTLCRHPCR